MVFSQFAHRLIGVLLYIALAFSAKSAAAEWDQYLPDDTEAVFVINARQVAESGVFKKYFRQQWEQTAQNNLDDRPWLNFLDPEAVREITRVTVALPPGPIEKKGVIVINGKFDLGKIKALAESYAQIAAITLKIRPADSIPLYEVRLDDPPARFLFAAFPDEETVVASPSRDAILDVIAKASGKKKTRINSALLSMVKSVDYKQSIWYAGKIPELWKNDLGKMPQFKVFAPKMVSFSGGVALTDSIKAGLHVQLTENQAAVDFKQVLELSKILANGLIVNTPSLKDHAPVLAEVLTALQFNQDKSIVGIEVTIPDTLIEKALPKNGRSE